MTLSLASLAAVLAGENSLRSDVDRSRFLCTLLALLGESPRPSCEFSPTAPSQAVLVDADLRTFALTPLAADLPVGTSPHLAPCPHARITSPVPRWGVFSALLSEFSRGTRPCPCLTPLLHPPATDVPDTSAADLQDICELLVAAEDLCFSWVLALPSTGLDEFFHPPLLRTLERTHPARHRRVHPALESLLSALHRDLVERLCPTRSATPLLPLSGSLSALPESWDPERLVCLRALPSPRMPGVASFPEECWALDASSRLVAFALTADDLPLPHGAESISLPSVLSNSQTRATLPEHLALARLAATLTLDAGAGVAGAGVAGAGVAGAGVAGAGVAGAGVAGAGVAGAGVAGAGVAGAGVAGAGWALSLPEAFALAAAVLTPAPATSSLP